MTEFVWIENPPLDKALTFKLMTTLGTVALKYKVKVPGTLRNHIVERYAKNFRIVTEK